MLPMNFNVFCHLTTASRLSSADINLAAKVELTWAKNSLKSFFFVGSVNLMLTAHVIAGITARAVAEPEFSRIIIIIEQLFDFNRTRLAERKFEREKESLKSV